MVSLILLESSRTCDTNLPPSRLSTSNKPTTGATQRPSRSDVAISDSTLCWPSRYLDGDTRLHLRRGSFWKPINLLDPSNQLTAECRTWIMSSVALTSSRSCRLHAMVSCTRPFHELTLCHYYVPTLSTGDTTESLPYKNK